MRLAQLLVAAWLGCGCAARPAATAIERAALQEALREAPGGGGALARLRAGLAPSRLDEVARVAAGSASASFVISAAALQAAMASTLGSGAWPHVLSAWGNDDQIAARLEAALAELRAHAELAEVGFAVDSGRAGRVGVIVALPPPRLPIAIERGGGAARVILARLARLDGLDGPTRLAGPTGPAGLAGLAGPTGPWSDTLAVYAVGPTASHRLEVERSGDALEVMVDCGAPAAIEVRDGARVIATVLDACAPGIAAGELPPAIDIGPPARTPVEAEMRVWELVNRDRVAHGVPALAWDPASHRFARAHAAEMARAGYVGHHAAGGASYAARVASAPFTAVSSRENVGHAWGPGEVHEAFLRSAGHRANVLAGDVDRGAVGAAVDPADPRAIYVVEFFRR